MILILAHHFDLEAEWLHRTLRDDYAQASLLLWPEALAVDYRITLALHGDGRREADVAFFDRTVGALDRETFDCQASRYAINRLSYIEPSIWKNADTAEKAYAESEINAFFSAFVRALPCPVSNPARHGALWTQAGFEARWASALHRSGVAVDPRAFGDPAIALAALSVADPSAVRRWMYFDGAVLAPPGQTTTGTETLGRAVLERAPDEVLEFVAIEESIDAPARLLWVSRTPALSCYGSAFIDMLIDRAVPARA